MGRSRLQMLTFHSKSLAQKAPAGKSKTTIILRLTEPIDYAVRAAMLHAGDMSDVVTKAIQNVNLKTVKLLETQGPRTFGGFRSTTVNVESQVHQLLKKAAQNRGCSMNLLINSVLAEHLKPFLQSDFRDKIRATWEKVRQRGENVGK